MIRNYKRDQIIEKQYLDKDKLDILKKEKEDYIAKNREKRFMVMAEKEKFYSAVNAFLISPSSNCAQKKFKEFEVTIKMPKKSPIN